MVKQVFESKLFAALGDKTRFNILLVLMNGEQCACGLPKLVNRAQPTVSLQLKYLTGLGLLSFRKEGKKVLYKIEDKRIIELVKIAKRGE